MHRYISKTKEYILTALWIAKTERKNLLVVVYKIVVAYRYGLGVRYFSHYGLVHRQTSDYAAYVHKYESDAIQRQLNHEHGRLVADSKLLFYKKCLQHQLRTPAILGCLSADCQSGEIQGVPCIRNVSHFMKLLSDCSSETFIFKLDYGSYGRGMVRFHRADEMLYDDHGQLLEPRQLLDDLLADNQIYILQPALKPHESLRPIMPGKGLGSARIITVTRGGQTSVVFACIKIPIGDNISDNWVVGRAGNLLADIDIASGIIGRCFAPSKTQGNLIEPCVRHPESRQLITGFEFPYWREMINTAQQAALKFDSLVTVGWDIALCEEGPTLLEANWRYDFDLLQTTSRKGLKPEMMSLLRSESTVLPRPGGSI